MIRVLLHIVLVALVGVIAFQLMSQILGIIPPPKKLKIRSKHSGPDLNALFRPAYHFIGNLVYMEPNREAVQGELLHRAGIDLTPRELMGRNVFGILLGALVCLWGYVLGGKIIMLFGIVFGVALFGVSNSEASERLKQKDAEVKKELPKFVATIVVALRSEKNIIKIIESYIKDAKPALRSDLEVLLSQMTTGNIETALRNFDIRMGAQEISSLTTSLIYIENGVDQTAALQYLESDMRQAQAAMRRAELAKLPDKMKSAFIPIGIVLIAMFFYTIFVQIFENFALFF